MARILIVTNTPHHPATSGYSQRVTAVIAALTANGHQVRTVSVRPLMLSQKADPSQLLAADQSGLAVRKHRAARIRVLTQLLRTPSISLAKWYSAKACDVLAALIHTWQPQVVLLESSYLAPYRCLFSCPVIFDLHNIESQLVANYAKDRRGLTAVIAELESKLLARLEATIPGQAFGVATVSQGDQATLARIARLPADVIAAPNGVTDQAFEVADQIAQTSRPTAAFIGHLGWRPNIDGAKWIATEVWPLVTTQLPTAQLQLIGRDPDPTVQALADHRAGISVHGNVPSVFPYLAGAAVATAPLWTAGGTRLKILEALGTATPVVATSLGALGLEQLAEPGVLDITDDPKAFAQALVRYLNQPAKSNPARAAATAYRWSRTLTGLVDMVERAAR